MFCRMERVYFSKNIVGNRILKLQNCFRIRYNNANKANQRGARRVWMVKLSLDLQPYDGGGRPILVVSGEIDVFTAPRFKQAVLEMTDQGTRELFLDMRGVAFMDSSGLGALLEATRRLRQIEGSLHL